MEDGSGIEMFKREIMDWNAEVWLLLDAGRKGVPNILPIMGTKIGMG